MKTYLISYDQGLKMIKEDSIREEKSNQFRTSLIELIYEFGGANPASPVESNVLFESDESLDFWKAKIEEKYSSESINYVENFYFIIVQIQDIGGFDQKNGKYDDGLIKGFNKLLKAYQLKKSADELLVEALAQSVLKRINEMRGQ